MTCFRRRRTNVQNNASIVDMFLQSRTGSGGDKAYANLTISGIPFVPPISLHSLLGLIFPKFVVFLLPKKE